MTSSPKITVIIALGDFASGVTSWALRLRDAFAEHPRYTIRLMNCTDTGNRIGTFDMQATSRSQARDLIAACGEVVVLPNFVWDLFPVCADLIARGHPVRCVGFCRADSEDEYYAPLQWYAPLVNRFAAVSPTCTATLASRLGIDPGTIHTLPTGVWIPDQLRRNYQTAPLRIAYGGRIVQDQKRVLDFVPLVEGLYQRKVDFHFTLIGSGRQRDTLAEALAQIDPEGRVEFAPRRKPGRMPSFWAAQDVFIQTSAFEGTSNSMLESMAQGAVPVVTHTASGVDGIVHHGDNGYLVDVGDMNAMADHIAALARSQDELARMGHRAYESMAPYSMTHYVERFTTLLDGARSGGIRSWPENRTIVPPTPFHGIRLRQDDGDSPPRRRLAILFPSPLRGGAEDYTLTIARGALRAGYEVQGAFPNKEALRSLADDYFQVGAFHNTLDICDVGPKSDQAPAYKRFTRTYRLLRRLQPDAVLFQLCGMQYGLLSLLACACLKQPTLVVFQLVREDRRFSPLRRALYRWMRGRGQHYVAVSDANRRLLAQAFAMSAGDITTIPNGVDLARYNGDTKDREAVRNAIRATLGLPADALLCLSVGRLAPQKGHDVLVPAIPHIVAKHPRVHFLWAGEGPSEKTLRAQRKQYGVADRVHFLGKRDDIPDLLLAADLFVHPARFEGQPFSLLEAMAAGLPLVSTTASGITEVIEPGRHGILCPPDDIAALRDAVINALNHPEAMTKRALAARARVRTFSEAAMIEQTLATLESMMEPR